MPECSKKLWFALSKETETHRNLQYPFTLTTERIKQLQWELREILQEHLIHYRGGSIRVGEYIERWQKIPISNRPRIRTRGDLSHKMAVWMRDELLLREAFKHKLNQHPAVKKEVQQFMENHIYFHYLQQRMSALEIPPAVQEYFRKMPRQPHPTLGKFHTLEEWKWWKAERELIAEWKTLPREIKIDSTLVKKESRQIDWQSRVRLFAFPKPE